MVSKRRAKSDADGSIGTGAAAACQHLQAARVSRHKAIEQRRIQAMQVGDGICHSEHGLEIEMQGTMAQRRKVNQGNTVLKRLQSESQIYARPWWLRFRPSRSRW